MQGDGSGMTHIQMLVNHEQIVFTIDVTTQGLMQGRQMLTGDHHHGTMNLGDNTDGYMFTFISS